MGDSTVGGRARETIDRLAAHRASVVVDDTIVDEAFLRCYFAHVDAGDLGAREVIDLFGLAADHSRLAAAWSRGTTAIAVVNPRVDVDGWDNDHTVVMIVTDDLPFLVDSVTMELSRLGLGIHLVIHPILVDLRDEGGRFADPRDHPDVLGRQSSLIAVEIDRQSDETQIDSIADNLRRVLDDVGRAVDDWAAMRDRMSEISDGLAVEPVPFPPDEVEETQELLDWLCREHFVFLGYREYQLDTATLASVPSTGLGILRANGGAESERRQLSEMAPRVRERAAAPVLLNITKTTSRSTIHRASHLDYIGIKTFAADGTVSGERRFLGLFTSEAYTSSTTQIPRLRRLVSEVVERAGFPPGGHDEKRLVAILEGYPRDELFQIDADDLYETAIAIAQLQERRRVRVFARPELFGRFVTCMVYMPRDRYNTESRTAIQDLLVDAYGGSSADWSTDISESVLSRTLFHIRVDNGVVNEVDPAGLEAQVEELLRDWRDDFDREVQREFGEDMGVDLARLYAEAFKADYRAAFTPRAAVADVHHLEALGASDDLRLNVYREPGQPGTAFKLKLYRRGERVSLTSVMPTLNNLGVTVVDERPYEVRAAGADPVWIYDFALEHPEQPLGFSEVAELVESTFDAVWHGRVADDGFNRLVLGAGMGHRDVGILRAYSRYLHQTRVAYSQPFIEQTLIEHAGAARLLVELFVARFDPATAEADHGESRAETMAEISERFSALVEDVHSLDQDRVLRRFHNLIESTLRTNCFQVVHGEAPPYLAFKLDPMSIDDLPEPRPKYEIFVYSPRFEGVHLRSGAVARGGLRWSDRLEDYRTEVLGLVKAQMVKNAVIVPGGAKGGFVLQRDPADPEARREEVETCYRLFVSALLDLTDNLVDGDVVPPTDTVRYDGDDTYLVVAADKGTATFSDVANELATGRGMWLGDAFASGGSNGYDHKAMGITARGAWESVKRHFRELGRNIQEEPFTAIGVGDMSGDVFGNGMLLSEHTQLLAAFDHRHVFIDPTPDAAISHAERRRLFGVPRSSWDDYDRSLISEGGGVYPRSAKSIELSPQVREVLAVDAASLTPDELITAVLRAPAELLWNGGIGTYVKAAQESHADVGDKANDAIRVDGGELRVKVLGEGGNLGVTQLGRIEFAQAGGRVYTDAIDNAGGVDCSDHEVNIKILLDQVTDAGDLTAKQRNELLEEMTDEVADLVLANNYNQTQALSTARSEAASMADVHARYLVSLEGRGLLDCGLERLPDTEAMADRMLAGLGLTTPELAVLLAYTKNTLNEELLASPLPDEETFDGLLLDYFPEPIRERYPDQIRSHRLRREIVANRVSNLVVDRGGTSMVYRLTQETSAPSPDVVAAHMAAWEIFQLDELGRAVNHLDGVIPAVRQLAVHLSGRQLAERATRLMVRNRPYPFSTADAVTDLAGPVSELLAYVPDYLAGSDRAAFDQLERELIVDGMPEDLARRVASLSPSLAVLDVVDVSAESGVVASTVAEVYFTIADRLELNWLRDHILALPRDTQWSSLARLTLRGDLYGDHRDLVRQVVAPGGTSDDLVEDWVRRHAVPVDYFRRTITDIRAAGPTDLTTLLVAARELRNLIARTT